MFPHNYRYGNGAKIITNMIHLNLGGEKE